MSHTMHGKWSQPGVPHKGWTCGEIYDLEEPSQVCEMCELMMIRYVHVMTHPDYPGQLECGCICAGHMEEDLAGARLREKAFKLTLKRKRRLLERQWSISQAGNEYLNIDGFNIVVYRRLGFWYARVTHRSTGVQLFTRWSAKTAEEAKITAFEIMQEMAEAIAKRRPDEPHDWRGY